MAAKLKKGDTVIVLAGKDKGKSGEITAVMPKDNKAIVDGVNMAIRHTRQSQTSQGGRVAKAMPSGVSGQSHAAAGSDAPASATHRMGWTHQPPSHAVATARGGTNDRHIAARPSTVAGPTKGPVRTFATTPITETSETRPGRRNRR